MNYINNKLSITSLVGTPKILEAAKKISGAGFKFSNASADTIASNLKEGYKLVTISTQQLGNDY